MIVQIINKNVNRLYISKNIKKEYGMSLTNDEMMYLTVHIHRVTIK